MFQMVSFISSVVGILCLILATIFIWTQVRLEKKKVSNEAGFGAAGILFGAACIVIFGLNVWTVVPPGYGGVQSLGGRVYVGENDVLDEGFHFMNPFVDVDDWPLGTFTMRLEGEFASAAPTATGVTATIETDISIKPSKKVLPTLKRFFGKEYYNKDIFLPAIRGSAFVTAAAFDPYTLYGKENREPFNTQFTHNMLLKVDSILKPYPITSSDFAVAVNTRNIAFPPDVQKAMEAKQVEFERIQTAEFSIARAKNDGKAAGEFNVTSSRGLTPDVIEMQKVRVMEKGLGNPNATVIVGSGTSPVPVVIPKTADSGEKK